MRSHRSTVTLRAMIPYLVFYRILGLIPIYFKSNSVSTTLCRFSSERSWWKLWWTRLYSVIVLFLVTGFLYSNLPPLEALFSSDSGDVAGALEAANRFSICLNVFFTIAICFSYLGTKFCRLVNKMIRCEQELISLDRPMKGQLAVQCWIVLAFGIAAAMLNELAVNLLIANYSTNAIHQPTNTTTQLANRSPSLIGIFHGVMTPFVAGIWSFVDLSVIHLSLIFSSYQRQLRREIGRWSSLGLKAKERLRLTYWNVQALIKEADEIFSPAVLIGSLSCVAHLILEINLLIGTRTDPQYFQTTLSEKRCSLMATAITVAYLTVRFVASSLFAEMIHQEKRKSLRSLDRQSGEEFWSYDLELLITKRFVHQLTLPLGFTGCGFFMLGKSYLIAMCGTILTYEIVLMDIAKTERSASFDTDVNDSNTLFPPHNGAT